MTSLASGTMRMMYFRQIMAELSPLTNAHVSVEIRSLLLIESSSFESRFLESGTRACWNVGSAGNIYVPGKLWMKGQTFRCRTSSG